MTGIRAQRHRTPEDIESSVCRYYSGGLTMGDCAELHGLAYNTIRVILKRRGVKRRPRGGLPTPHANNILRDFDTGKAAREIASRYGVHVSTVRGIVQRSGRTYYTISQSLRRHSLNEEAFATLTDESAYWIGFLIARWMCLLAAAR